MLQGWSNGASAVLAAMSAQELPGFGKLTPQSGFRAGLAFYPACGLKGQFADGLTPYAPVRIFHGTADDEVSAQRCEGFVKRSRKRNADIEITLYPGAEHGFDDPGTQAAERGGQCGRQSRCDREGAGICRRCDTAMTAGGI